MKGYTQFERDNFNETFSPIVKMTIVSYLLTTVVSKGWELYKMDVSNAFLHRELYEEVYVEVPPTYNIHSHNMVYLLRNPL